MSTSSTSTSRLARAQGIPIVAVLETHVQADHVSGLPELVERTGATAYLPGGRRGRLQHHRPSPTASSSSSATPRSRRSRPQATRQPTTPTSSPTTAAADEPWLVLTGDALLVGDAGRPDLHAHGDQTVEEMAATLYRSLTERLLALPDHLAALPGSLLGLGLRPRPVRQSRLDDRLRAPTQPGAPVRLRAGVRRGADQGHPAGARAAGRDRRRQPQRAPARRGPLGVSAGPAGAAREPRAVLAARRRQRPRRGDGRPRALDPAADRARTSSGVGSSAAVLSFIVAFGLAKSFTNLGAGALAERVGRRRLLLLGWAMALPVPAADRGGAELGLDRRRERVPRRQPGAHLVDDGGDEDRPRRAKAARASRSG